MLFGGVIETQGLRTQAQRGAIMVQFALTLGFVLLLASGALDFGLMIRENALVESSARVGARTAAGITEFVGDDHHPVGLPTDLLCQIAKSATETFLESVSLHHGDFHISVNPEVIEIDSKDHPALRVTVTRQPRWYFLRGSAFGATASSVFLIEYPIAGADPTEECPL